MLDVLVLQLEGSVPMGKKTIALAAVTVMTLAGWTQASESVTTKNGAPVMTSPSPARVTEQASTTGRVVSAFAMYLSSLASQDQVSKEGLERGTSLVLAPISTGARYRSDDVGGGWHYIVEYFAGTKTIQRAAVLLFVNENNENADFSPVCDAEFDAVRSILIKGGYIEHESLGEIGNFLAWEYLKNDITVSLLPQTTVGAASQRRDCIRSIRVLG